MKNILTLIILLYSLLYNAQVTTKTQKVIKIVEPQSFYLNGGTRNMAGGNSRNGFKIDLPPNTVEWYYAFTTEPNKNDEQIIQLENQLNLILKTTGFSNNLLNLVKIPNGQGLIDIFLTDRKGYDLFFEKDIFGMWLYNSPSYIIEGSVKSGKDGKVPIDDVKTGSHYLVVRNTSATTGINVKLEVIAIVEESSTNLSVWSKNTKEILFNSMKNILKKSFLNYSEDKIDEVTGCVVTKFTNQYKPTDLNTLAEYEIKAITKKIIEECNQ